MRFLVFGLWSGLDLIAWLWVGVAAAAVVVGGKHYVLCTYFGWIQRNSSFGFWISEHSCSLLPSLVVLSLDAVE